MGLWTSLGLPSGDQSEHNDRIRKLREKAAGCKGCGGRNQKAGMFRCCGSIWAEIEFLEREWQKTLADREFRRTHPGFN